MSASRISVLVVEDEALIRLDLVSYLEQAGYRVVEAGSSQEAMEILERDRTIRVVFTDVRMPGDLDGLQLARLIRKRWPPTLIVVCSANVSEMQLDLADIQLLDKPYIPNDLATIVDALNDQLALHKR